MLMNKLVYNNHLIQLLKKIPITLQIQANQKIKASTRKTALWNWALKKLGITRFHYKMRSKILTRYPKHLKKMQENKKAQRQASKSFDSPEKRSF